MKFFLSGFVSETNTFSPFPTTQNGFDEMGLSKDLPPLEEANFWQAPLSLFKKLSLNNGWSVENSICAVAMPNGKVIEKDYQSLLNIILDDLKKTMPVNGVFLHLHGAMVSESCMDCEGDILTQVRKIVGPNVLISVLLDPHTHLSDTMINKADIMVWMKEYPHIDALERTKEIFDLSMNALAKKIKPTMASSACHTINLYPTQQEPMKAFVAKLKRIEAEDEKILSISAIHGFPYGDTPHTGSAMVVMSNNDPEYAQKMAQELADEFQTIARHKFIQSRKLQEILASVSPDLEDKLVLVDYADNVGGGAPGDSTFILKDLIEAKIPNFAISAIYDPENVRLCRENGLGNSIKLNIGGKHGIHSGEPVTLEVKVTSISEKLYTTFGDTKIYFGNTATYYYKPLDAHIVLNDVRCQTYSTDCFEFANVALQNKKFIVVKSSVHFEESFSKVTKKNYIVSTSGVLNPDFSSIDYIQSPGLTHN